MGDDLSDELLRNSVRASLRAQNVQLWSTPFVLDNGDSNENALKDLAQEYSSSLNIEAKDCYDMLVSLQQNAIKRIKEQEQFNSVGLATLHIRFSGFDVLPSEASSSSSLKRQKSEAEIEISINARGTDLLAAVSKLSSKPADRIKLIYNGRLVKSDDTLKNQGLKSSSRIMALALNSNINEVDEALEHQKLCENTRSAASTLAKKSKHQYASLELEDQAGSSLKVNQEEKEALCLALTLHERGRAFLKRGNHSLAFLLFLEADQEYGHCNSDVLRRVDNVALLQLDIVWCYLCLRSISHIPDAERRLNQCEVILERSYGKNLERVEAIKGTSGNEAALLMRLHLLQAIVAFHLSKIDTARELLQRAELELQSLRVNKDDVNRITALGYSSSEALMGLRACCGDLDAAVSQICEWQQERKKAREQNRKERIRESERVKLGKTADGSQYVEPDCVETLSGMGYDRLMAISALKHSNNNITQAVHLLQEQPHLLDIEKTSVHISSEDVTQIAAMGFDVDIARLALRKHHGSIEAAVTDLVNNNGIIVVDPDKLPPEEESESPCHSSGSKSSKDSGESDADKDEDCLEGDTAEDKLKTKLERKRRREQDQQFQAAHELENDIPEVENDYLCVTLEAEEQFLLEYKALLKF